MYRYVYECVCRTIKTNHIHVYIFLLNSTKGLATDVKEAFGSRKPKGSKKSLKQGERRIAHALLISLNVQLLLMTSPLPMYIQAKG